MSITKKINDLFALRKLPELCSNSNIKQGSPYYKGLIKLQKKIYDLDAYLERTWDIKDNKLEKYWDGIYAQLIELKVPKSRLEKYVGHIKKYQKHELQLRDGKLPFEYSLDYFYYYKSCDVKLIRQLIYDKIPSLSKLYTLGDWRFFDLITELHDDIEDVYEDIDSINGNCFLLSLNSKGLEQTTKSFQDMINEVEWKLDAKYSNVKKEASQRLYAVTKEAIMHLNILLMQRKDELGQRAIKDSIVLDKLSLELSF